MKVPDLELGQRAYEPEHVAKVLAAIEKGFRDYFQEFYSDSESTAGSFSDAIAEWGKEKPDYRALLDMDALEEYEDDPNAFKDTLRKKCPIIRRCLQSPMEEMKKYKIAFKTADAKNLLSVATNIARFGEEYASSFEPDKHEHSQSVDDLHLSVLLTDSYNAYGVIGGGIKSHFLSKLYPHAFSNRSQNAIWALYYLTDKQDFGFDDGSEFLMFKTDHDGIVVNQNYYYPYDLFAYYALRIYLMLRESLVSLGVNPDPNYRYVYVDSFLDRIAAKYEDEIRSLKGKDQYGYFG